MQERLYILYPNNILAENSGGDTFKPLKNQELRKLGEYRTRRLVLEMRDRVTGVRAPA